MNRFSFLTLYRSLIRHRLYAALNIGGLAIGIAVFLVLGLYVRFETSYETWLPRNDRIYIVQTVWNMPDSPFNGAYPNTMGGLLEEMKADFPGLVGTRINGVGATVLRGGIGTAEDLAWVDSQFFAVMDLPMLQGEGARALADPSSVLIDANIARKYFGSTDPVGQTLTLNIGAGTAPYRVAGVFAPLPRNTDLKFTMLARIPNGAPKGNEDWWYHWGSTSVNTYLRFPSPAAAKAFAARMPAFVVRHGTTDLGANADKTMQLTLLPLTDLHLTPAGREMASARQTILTLGIVGVLTLLIAIVNYVNLATARAGLRAREVAMRKVLGASRGMLVRQFAGEAILTTALAALVALALAELGLPLVNAAAGLALSIPYATVVPALLVLSVVVGIAAGLYPAVLLARFPAAAVLASARSPGGGRTGARLREMLVVFQFALATAFIAGTLVLVAQTRHLRQADLGFARDGLIVVKSLAGLSEGQQGAMRDAIADLPMIRSVGIADSAAGGFGNNNANNIEIPGRAGPGPSLREIVVGRDGRQSGPELAGGLAEGLRAAGVDVIDIGAAPTPVVYFATYRFNTGCGVAVTGSHSTGRIFLRRPTANATAKTATASATPPAA